MPVGYKVGDGRDVAVFCSRFSSPAKKSGRGWKRRGESLKGHQEVGYFFSYHTKAG